MALTIRILDEGEPVINTSVVMIFDGSIRIEDFTDIHGEIQVEPCRGSTVHLTVDGVAQNGVELCHDGMELELDRSE